MRNRNRWKILCMTTVFCAAAIIGCGTKTVRDSDVVMEIAGQSVVKEEYQMILAAHQTEIERQYDTDTVNHKDFWTTEQEGGTPLQQLMQLAETDLTEKKVIAKLAKDYGIAAKTDYLSIAAEMEEENGRRENGEDSGEVVYGLDSFGIENYYDYIYTQIGHALTEKLKQEQTVSEEDLENVYRENQKLYTSEVSVKMLVAETSVETGQEQMLQAAEEMKTETNPDVLASHYSNIRFYELAMSSLNMEEGKSGAYMQRWLTASVMQPGDVCQPMGIGGNLMAMRCLERSEQAVQPFEEIKGILDSDVRAQMAQEEIAGEVERADVRYEQEVLHQIALERLQP